MRVQKTRYIVAIGSRTHRLSKGTGAGVLVVRDPNEDLLSRTTSVHLKPEHLEGTSLMHQIRNCRIHLEVRARLGTVHRARYER